MRKAAVIALKVHLCHQRSSSDLVVGFPSQRSYYYKLRLDKSACHITECETNAQWAISRIYAYQITILMKFKKIPTPPPPIGPYTQQRINYKLHRRFSVTSSTHQTLKLHNNL